MIPVVALPPRPDFTDLTAEARATRVALAGAAARYTVALVLKDERSVGSGVLVSVGEALFVATARHIVTDLPPGDVYCIPMSPGPAEIVSREEVLRRAARGEVKAVERFLLHTEERVLSTADSDVALLQLGKRPPDLHDMKFYPLHDARSDPLAHPYVIVYGYAAELTIVHRPTGRGVALARVVAGKLGSVSDHEYDPARDLIVTYDDPRGPMAAGGMSGGGVWLPPAPGRGVWDLRAMQLVGIQVAQFPESRAAGQPLLATRIERVQALLRR